AANEYRRLTSNMSVLMQLLQNDGLGDWREINEAGRKHQAVTAADVRRVAGKYLTRENRTVGVYTRKARPSGGAAPVLPDVAGLTDEQRSLLRTMAGRLQQEKDAAHLKAALAKMEEAEGKADEAIKPFLQAQKKLVQQRLEELK